MRGITGLLKFMGMLVCAFVLPGRKVLHTQRKDKYDTLIGPSSPLVIAEPIFCPECHHFVACARVGERGVEIIQGEKVLVSSARFISIDASGRKSKGYTLMCPNGHVVRVG